MSNLFLIGLLGSLLSTILGLIKPSWVKVPSRKKALGIYGLAFVVCFVGFGVTHEKKQGTKNMQYTAQKQATGFESQFRTDQVLPYKSVMLKDVSFPGRKRYTEVIVLNKKDATYEEKAQTVFKAASNLVKAKDADVVNVMIEMSEKTQGAGYLLAQCEYAPDGGGYSGDQHWKCKIRASKENPTAQELMILDEWYANRHKFQKDGLTDEPKLKQYLAQNLNLPVDKISLPWIMPEEYYSN